ncbi:MAG TPA: hypothetical protein VJB82_04580 [Candidatus Peribacterales bacterium]|nr:hypothetical protein [Candidatus Peribacterales bacterium]
MGISGNEQVENTKEHSDGFRIAAEDLHQIVEGKKKIPQLPVQEKLAKLPIGEEITEQELQRFLHTLYSDLDDGISLQTFEKIGQINTTQLELQRLRQEMNGSPSAQKEGAAHRLAYYHYLPLRVTQNSHNLLLYAQQSEKYRALGYKLNNDIILALQSATTEHANTIAEILRERVVVGNYIRIRTLAKRGDKTAKSLLSSALEQVPSQYRKQLETESGEQQLVQDIEKNITKLLSGDKNEILPVEALLMQFHSDLLDENFRKERALKKDNTDGIGRILQEREEIRKARRTFHLSQGLRSLEAYKIVTLGGAFGEIYKGPANAKPGNIGGTKEMEEFLISEGQNIRSDFSRYANIIREQILNDDLPGIKAEELWNKEGRLLFLKISRRIAQLRALPKYAINQTLGDMHVDSLMGDLNEEFGLPRDFNHNDPSEWERPDVKANMENMKKKMRGTGEVIRNHSAEIMNGLELFQEDFSLLEAVKRTRNAENLDFLLGVAPDFDAVSGLPLDESSINKLRNNDGALLALCFLIFDRMEEKWKSHNKDLDALDDDLAKVLETHQGAKRSWGAGGEFPWILIALLTAVGADALFNRARITRYSTRMTYRAGRTSYTKMKDVYKRYRGSRGGTPPESGNGTPPEAPRTPRNPPSGSGSRSGRLRWGPSKPPRTPVTKPSAPPVEKPTLPTRTAAPSVQPKSTGVTPKELTPNGNLFGRELILYAIWRVGESQLASWAIKPLPQDRQVEAALAFYGAHHIKGAERSAEEMTSLESRHKLITMRGTVEGILERIARAELPDSEAEDIALLQQWGEELLDDMATMDEKLYKFFPITDSFIQAPGVREGIGVSTDIRFAREKGIENMRSTMNLSELLKKAPAGERVTMQEHLERIKNADPAMLNELRAGLKESLNEAKKTPFQKLEEEYQAFEREAARVMACGE